MLYGHLKLVIRNFLSGGLHLYIIVLGLAIGFAVNLIIAQYIYFELSFDKQYPDRDRMYYTYMYWEHEGQGSLDSQCHPAIAPLITNNIEDVESVVRMAPAGLEGGHEWVLKRLEEGRASRYIRVNHMYIADPNIFEFLSIDMIAGDQQTALQDPHSVVITRSVADLFFPDEPALGKMLSVQDNELKVTGIINDPDVNSSFQYKVFFPMAFLDAAYGESYLETMWLWPAFPTFIRLKPGSDFNEVQKEINLAAKPNLEALKKNFHIAESIVLYPFSDFHFYRSYNSSGVSPVEFTGDKRVVYFFGALGLLILIISWSNYINLAVARALQRAKEVSVRKVSGANRWNLFTAFLVEFLFLNSISLVLAFTITQLSFNAFAMAIGSRATWMLWKEPVFWIILIAFTAVSTLASGIYPAFVMSNYNSVKVLKGNFSRSLTGIKLKRTLVLIQFVLSTILVMSIYVITRQLNFMQNKELGMSPEQVFVIRLIELNSSLNREVAFDAWRNKIESRPDILSAALVSNYPGDVEPRAQYYALSTDPNRHGSMESLAVTGGYLRATGISLLHGRMLNDDSPSDSTKIVVNETATRSLGFASPELALGHKLTFMTTGVDCEIIGVVKDFSTSLKIPASGSVFHFKHFAANVPKYFIMKLSSQDMLATVAGLKDDWDELFDHAAFDYFFLDEYFDAFYKQERQFRGVFGFFSVIGIVITCMGLFGLSIFNTTSRTKEIGIRKSLGGSAMNIMWMFSKEYLSLVVIAGVIGIPLGAYILDSWLSNYPQRIPFNVDIAIIPLVTMVLIAQFAVGYHVFKVAHANPVKSLRSE
ncbi:MAG: ABC transporter permease [Chryseolinea sp.]